MTDNQWFLPAMMALFTWGVTAFLPKLVLRRLKPLQMIAYSSCFFMVTAFVVQLFYLDQGGVQFEPRGVALAMATGCCGAFGQIFYLQALKNGSVAHVSMISSLYPLIATLLAFIFLHEPMTIRQGVGVLLGLSSIILLVVANDSKK
ncbi:MAG: EamA family transporter [Alphaproteobacteria bacterium]